jgi:hypothetical protein
VIAIIYSFVLRLENVAHLITLTVFVAADTYLLVRVGTSAAMWLSMQVLAAGPGNIFIIGSSPWRYCMNKPLRPLTWPRYLVENSSGMCADDNKMVMAYATEAG